MPAGNINLFTQNAVYRAIYVSSTKEEPGIISSHIVSHKQEIPRIDFLDVSFWASEKIPSQSHDSLFIDATVKYSTGLFAIPFVAPC